MSSNNESSGVRFVWYIENFSCLTEGTIQSPSFSSNSIDWEVQIDLNYFSDSICFLLKQLNLRAASLNCSLALLDTDGLPLLWREHEYFNASSRYAAEERFYGISRDDVFGSRKTKFLANDTLRVQCLICNRDGALDQLTSIFARTRIEPCAEEIKRCFIWRIPNITRSLTPSRTFEHVEALTRGGEWLKIQLNAAFRAKISISLARTFVKCVIFLRTDSGKNIQFVEREHSYEKMNEEWSFEIPITKHMLTYYKNQFLPDDALSLIFQCNVLFKVSFSRVVEKRDLLVNNPQPNIVTPLVPTTDTKSIESNRDCSGSNQFESEQPNALDRNVSRDLMGMLQEGLMSDFNFRVQDKTFPVHKNILSARSSVFRAMFTSDMKERESSSVDIPDVEADTFQRMLNFIYSDLFDDGMQWESASELYSVADKYALEPLKQKCSGLLKSGLCVSSVLDILLLGDTHQDDDLKAATLDFLAINDREMVVSERWKMFAKENVLLAYDTLQKLYEKKVCT